MSELNSLFFKVHIDKIQFGKFLEAVPLKPELDKNWLEWWNSREMSGKIDLTQEMLKSYNDENKSIINIWIENWRSFSFSDYDEENKIWHFGIIFFAESYSDILSMILLLKSIELYTAGEKDDFGIIYPFFWGDSDVMVYFQFENEKILLRSSVQKTSDVDPQQIRYANYYLAKKYNELCIHRQNVQDR